MGRPTKWIIIGAGILGCLLALAAGLLLLAGRALDKNKLRGMAEARLTQALGRSVTIAALDYSLFPVPVIRARGIKLAQPVDKAALPLSLSGFEVWPEIMPLLSGRVVITRVDVDGLDFALHRDRTGHWQLPIGPSRGEPSGGKAATLEIGHVRLRNGHALVTDDTLLSPNRRPLSLEIKGLTANWLGGAGGAATTAVSGALAGGGTLKLEFSQGGGFKAYATLKGVPARTLAPLLWSYVRLAPSSGQIDVEAKASGPGFNSFTADLQARMIALTSPGFGSPTAAFKPLPVTATFKAGLTGGGGSFRIPSLAVSLPHTTVSGSGDVGDKGATVLFTSSSVDNRDLPTVMSLLGIAPIPGLGIEGRVPLAVKVRVPSGPAPFSAAGQASVQRLHFQTLTLERVDAPFAFSRGVLTLSPFTFDAYGGHQRGSVRMDLNRAPMAYSVNTSVDSLDVNAALSANTTAKDKLYGKASAEGAITGAGFDAGALKRTLAGTARVGVKDGVIKNFPLLANINRALKITGGEGKDTNFDSLDGHFVIGGGKAHSDDLFLQAGELRVAAQGDLGLDLTLNFKGVARFSPAKSQEIVGKVGEMKRFLNAKGKLEFPLSISGTVASPSVNVELSEAVKKQLEDELKKSVLDKLLGK